MSFNEYDENGEFLPEGEEAEESFPWSFTETCSEEGEDSDSYSDEEPLNLGGYGSFLKGFSSPQETPDPPRQLVSGVGIVDDSREVSADDNEAILAKLNEENRESEIRASEDAKQRRAEEEAAEADERRRATERILEERYLKEQEEKAKREESRRLEEEQRAEKEERRRERNPIYRMKAALAKKKVERDKKKAERDKKIEKEAEALEEDKKTTASETEPVTMKEGDSVPEKKPPKPKKKEPKKRGSKGEDWEYIATHDRQTDLLNQVALEREAEDFGLGAVLYIAIKDFATVKDRYDAKTETEIVRAFATVLKAGYSDAAFRIGTEEFVLVCSTEERDRITLQLETFVGKAGMASYSLVVGSSFVNGDLIAAVGKAKADAVAKERLPKEGASSPVSQDYDALLTKDQRELKEQIQENHTPANKAVTSRIIAEIQSRQNEVNVILIASANFDALFIIRNINTFVRLVIEMDHLIDYSYLYVVYDGGAQYYGTDEYLKKVTNLFEDIAEGIVNKHIINKKDVAKVKGINVFKKIYFE